MAQPSPAQPSPAQPSPARRAALERLLVMATLLAAPGVARAWTANFQMSQTETMESSSISFSWNVAPSTCHPVAFDHYEVCLNEGGTAPTSPAAADHCKIVGPRGVNNTTYMVHRASRAYAGKIFACVDTYCTVWYGDGSSGCTSSGTEDTVTTAPECHVVYGVEDRASEKRVLSWDDYPYVTAVEVLFYPDDWTYEGMLAMWWVWKDPYDDRPVLSYRRADNAGWWDFNDQGNWDLGSEAEVAKGFAIGSDPFTSIGHPAVVPEVDSEDNRGMRMMLVTGDSATGSGPKHLVMLSSLGIDEEGADFGLTCVGACGYPGCAEGEPCDWDSEVAVLGYAFDWEAVGLSNDQHGTFVWDLIAYGPVDFDEDDPMFLFSGGPTGTGTGTCFHTWGSGVYGGDAFGPGAADLYLAEWNPTSDPGEEWEVTTVPTDSTCPQPEFIDQHDPTAFGLPFDEHKIYMQNADADQRIDIWYGSPGAWEESPGELVICLDTDDDPCQDIETRCERLAHPCIEDVRHHRFGEPHNEGLMFLAHESGYEWVGAGGLFCNEENTEAEPPTEDEGMDPGLKGILHSTRAN
jgi:hypothetical protein